MASQIDQLRRLQIPRPDAPQQPPRRNRRRALALGAAVVLAVAGGVFAWRRLSAVPATQVETARATAELQSSTGIVLTASGYIVAHHRIDVNSKVTGRVAWIGVEKGDKVKEGQVLVRLEDQEFRAQMRQAQGEVGMAEARLKALLAGSRPEEIQRDLDSLKEAEATFANDKDTLTRNEKLYAQDLISLQQLQESKAKCEASEHRVASLRQVYQMSLRGPRREDIDQARADLEQAKGKLAFSVSQLEATQIRAPLSGTILERTAEKGELITAQFATAADTGGPRGSVVALANLSDLQVQVDISQDDFARLAGVKRAQVTMDAYPERQYAALIAQVSPEANRQKATVEVRVQILQPDDLLRPEMNANVTFVSDGASRSSINAIEVPFSSVISRNGARLVLVQSGDRVTEKQVRLIGKKTTGYLVEGINDGDIVVVDPPAGLKTGDRIQSGSH